MLLTDLNSGSFDDLEHCLNGNGIGASVWEGDYFYILLLFIRQAKESIYTILQIEPDEFELLGQLSCEPGLARLGASKQ